MVKYTVILDPAAQVSLRRIYNYLKEQASEDTADKVRDGILDAIENLSEMPQRHKIMPEISDEQTIYRRVLKWSYKIIFSIDEAKILVKVVEITHIKQNPQTLIEKFKK